MLARSLSADLLSDRSGFPFLTRGRALLLVADFGGHHQKQNFDTYTFLILGPRQEPRMAVLAASFPPRDLSQSPADVVQGAE